MCMTDYKIQVQNLLFLMINVQEQNQYYITYSFSYLG